MKRQALEKKDSKNIHHRPSLKWILFSILGISFIYLAIGAYAANKVTQVDPNHPKFDKTPGDYGLEYENIDFLARGDNLRISAWFIPNLDADKALILVHGRNASKQNAISGTFPRLGSELHNAGYAILMLDLRAHGDSEGKGYSFGVYERRDVLGAVDWLMDKGFKPGSIGALGISLGGGAVIGAASEESAIGAVILDSTFADINPLIELKWKEESGLPKFFLPGVYLMNQVIKGYNFKEIKPVNEIKSIPPRPVLILHCLVDEEVNYSHAEQLNAAIPASTFVSFDNCSHAELYRDFPDEYRMTVTSFLAKEFS